MSAVILQFPHPKRAEAKAMIDRIEESLGNAPRSEYPPGLMDKAVRSLPTAAREPVLQHGESRLYRMAEIVAERAQRQGIPCTVEDALASCRSALAQMREDWRATETPLDRELLAKARAAIAALPPRRPEP
jgi:hypothetical protein